MYPSKILLFGEYTILAGSQALAMPYHRYTGEWASRNSSGFNPPDAERSNTDLKKLVNYLKLEGKDMPTKYMLDISSFERDLDDGLFFNSNIPTGTGLGSSGAIAAAVFSRYSDAGSSEPTLDDLRTGLASIEAFYHGVSSGIDPLVSYLSLPVYFKNISEFASISIPGELLVKSGLFLVDTTKKRNTRSLVSFFNRKYSSDQTFSDKLNTQYIPLNNRCIQYFTSPLFNIEFFKSMKELTRLQLDCFSEMIPEDLIPVIKNGLDKDLFFMKLCGAGGGGYLLGFTADISGTRRFFENERIAIEVYGE
jgi:mevalonate kinase